MRVLVTGSSGHLGEALMRLLPSQGFAPTGMDSAPAPLTSIVGDIRDPAVVAKGIEGVDAVLHTATLHKPHMRTHAPAEFVQTNIAGTLTLLEAAVQHGVTRFIFTSTTSAFGAALTPPAGDPAAWIDEAVLPVPKNIYGATKTGAEELCHLYHRTRGIDCLVLRTSRFFPEPDDDPAKRAAFEDQNLKANEFLFRRVDVEDAARAHIAALGLDAGFGFDRLIISATTPFARSDCAALGRNAAEAAAMRVPGLAEAWQARGWSFFTHIDRVYDNGRARRLLSWTPRWDAARIVQAASNRASIGSDLSRTIGIKGYHDREYADGLYPVASS